MDKKEVFALLKNEEVFTHFYFLLVSLGLAEKIESTKVSINKIKLSDKGLALINKREISEEFLRKYRNMFPIYKKGTKGAVKAKLEALIEQQNCSEETILEATSRYLRSVENHRYCQQADYFISKIEKDGTERSTILEFIEEVESDEHGIDNSEEGYGWEIV